MANRLPGLKEGRCIGVILEWGLGFLLNEAQTYSMPLHTPTSIRLFAVIPCAGFGSRAGTATPKQYQDIAGLPVVVHTLKAFAGVARMAQGVLVLAPDDVHMDGVLVAHPQPLFATSRTGGATRAESVLAGLRALLKNGAHDIDWVLVHDAARCLVTPEQINALIDACQDDAVGGLLAHKLADTLKAEANGRVSHTVDRADKWLAQTPQMFRIGVLLNALEHAGAAVTDEASAIEAMGLSPLLVPGNAQNFKVTYPEDFALAAAILNSRH
jgi:2-C-methyl-D-erythritol 4-phosphate cytidylyltransferase